MDLEFIIDTKLRNRIGDAITYILVLDTQARGSKEKVFQTETCRVIILYAHSAIEALLHEVYEQADDCLYRTDYKDPSVLNKNFTHRTIRDAELVVAVRKKIPKKDHEIGFHDLVTFFEKKMLKKETVARMLKLNGLRNSLHLKKLGSVACTINDVDEALQLIELTIKNIPRFVSKWCRWKSLTYPWEINSFNNPKNSFIFFSGTPACLKSLTFPLLVMMSSTESK